MKHFHANPGSQPGKPLLLLCVVALLAMAMLGGCAAAAQRDLPDGARILRDLAYGADPAQRLDVYLPPNAKGAPVILMVHGGGWSRGDKALGSVVASKAARWVPQGYIFISVNNRLLPEADPLQQADDVATALAFAQSNAASWGGDAGRFILMGHSAGAHLVALLAASPAIATRQGARPWLGTVPLDSAAFDVIAIMQDRHLGLYDRAFGGDPDFWRSASPLHRLAAAPAPMLLVCSSRRAVACAQAEAFAAKATALGGDVSLLPVDLSHRGINTDLGEPGNYTERVEAFLHRLAKP
ncbi:MAG: alpha/beta hydrolase [Kiloniellaceae bacterium]